MSGQVYSCQDNCAKLILHPFIEIGNRVVVWGVISKDTRCIIHPTFSGILCHVMDIMFWFILLHWLSTKNSPKVWVAKNFKITYRFAVRKVLKTLI